MPPIKVPQDRRWPDVIVSHLATVLNLKYGPPGEMGWSPRLRQRFGYCTPDELCTEAAVSGFVGPDTCWLDVGYGRDLFPSNPATARLLADRCRLLVGLHPSGNINDNKLLHEHVCCTIEEYRADRTYDLVTLRMVAEHIEAPKATVAALSQLVKFDGHVIIYTVGRWTPAALLAAATPMAVHHRIKRTLWNAAERDTFPTFYRMNTHNTLRHLFEAENFVEELFRRLKTRAYLASGKYQRLWSFIYGVGCARSVYLIPRPA